eukprot:196536_1
MLLKEKSLIPDEITSPLIWTKLLLGHDQVHQNDMKLEMKNAPYGLIQVSNPKQYIEKDVKEIFSTASHQQLLITISEALQSLFNDYHQTMTSVSSVLLLFFDAKTVFEMMMILARHPKYNMSSRWRHNVTQQRIDMYVLYSILQRTNPELYDHLS